VVVTAIGAAGPGDPWVAGARQDPAVHQPVAAFLERWSGTGWAGFPVPASAAVNPPVALSAVSAADIWAVGYTSDFYNSNC
jgi:hypothetical protein